MGIVGIAEHAESFFLVRVAKTIFNGIKAFFGRYTVSVLGSVTPRLVAENPDSKFAKVLCKPLSAYQIDVVKTFSDKGEYLANKITQLCSKGRNVQVKLAFKPGGVEAVPMYYSKNERSETLNCKVHRSACDRKDAGKRIECRHLSWGYVTGVFGRGKHSFHPVDSRSALKVYSHRFPTDKDLRDHFNEKHCGEGYYFARSTFSHAIQSIAEKYWNMPNGTDKAFLVWFNTHSMALRFKKQEGCIKVIFYDPNDTGRHKTFPLYDPGNARALELEDYCFLPDSHEFDSGIILSDDTREHIEQCNVNVFGDVDFQLLDGNIEHLAGHKDHPTIKASRRRNPGVNRRQG